MAGFAGRRRGGGAHADYTWPGYVDALASLLMAFVFLISFYAVGQVALSSAVSDRDSAIDKLNAQLAALGDVLNIERAKSADLDRRLTALGTQLRERTSERDRLTAQLRDAQARIEGFIRERDDLSARIAALGRERDELKSSVAGFVRERDAAAAAASKSQGEADALKRQLAGVTSERDAAIAAAARAQGEADELKRLLEGASAAATKSQDDVEAMQRRIAAMTTDRERLRTELARLLAERERLAGQLKDVDARAKAQLADDKKMADALKAEIERQKLELTRLSAAMAAANDEKGKLFDDLTVEQKLNAEQKAAIVRLTAEIAAIKKEMARLGDLLDIKEKQLKEQNTQIVDLGTRLNRALASKVEELARYRSEFFGKLREALAGRSDVTVVGDRFVFQSEVLFDPARAALKEEGEQQLVDFAKRLREITERIPSDVDWVLQVDGHTDVIPINTPQFRSNWELSTARAIAVVRVLEANGIPANRLVAAGHAEYKPLVTGRDPESRAKNRRIELKITSR